MPKLGQRLPYRVTYAWDGATKTGAASRATLDSAELLADRIEGSARAQGRAVTITIAKVSPRTKAGAPGLIFTTITVDATDPKE